MFEEVKACGMYVGMGFLSLLGFGLKGFANKQKISAEKRSPTTF